MKKMKMGMLVMLSCLLGLCACGNDTSKTETITPTPTVAPTEAEAEVPEGDGPIAVIEVQDYGTIRVQLCPDVAPITANNFIELAESGFYDGLTFHRIMSGFMIQGGDPNGVGNGGPGYSIKGEFSSNGFKNDLKHKRGVISMARTMAPDSAGSQFFIMHADYPYLDGEYAAFGMMLEGFDVLDAIATVETNRNDAPLSPVVIDTIRVETFGVDYGEPEVIR